MTVGPSFAASLETLAHRLNVASLMLFYEYYFDRCFSELVQLALLPFSQARSTRHSDRLLSFSVTILDVTRVPMATVSFLAQLDSGIICL